MGLRINFADTTVGENEAKPNGWYHVAVTDVEIKESGPNAKHPGKEYWNYELTIQDGDYKDRKFWVNATLLPHALFTLKGMLQAASDADGNLKYTKAQVDGELDLEAEDLVGCHMMAKNQQREYENEMRDNIRGFKPIKDDAKPGAAAVNTNKAASLMP